LEERKKTLQELEFKDSFMFAAVMMDKDNAKGVIESGFDHEELPKSYVIFICDFDPIGLRKYKYTRIQGLKEKPDYEYEDGSYTIFLSTVGENDNEVADDLVKFLKYVRTGSKEDNHQYDDIFVRQLQKSVEKIKLDREMGGRYMLFELICRDEFREGKAEGRSEGKAEFIISLLEDVGPVSDYLKEEILSIKSEEELARLHKKAAKVASFEEFEKELGVVKQ